jgi:hypothetical protein
VPDVVTEGYKQEAMQKAVKMTSDNGLYIIGNFIFGLPDDDYESMRETSDFTFFRLAALPYVSVYMGGLDERLFFLTYVGGLLIAPFLVAEVIKAMLIRLKTSKG